MNFIGIDPGKSGGIAIIREDGSIAVAPFSEWEYRSLLSTLDCRADNIVACIEQVHAFSGQGVTSCFTFGQNFGWIQGLLYAYSIEAQLVSPVKWKRHYNLIFNKHVDKKAIKEASIEKARRLFPNVCMKRSVRCKKDSDGMAEALLIANYAKECFKR